MKEKKKCKNLTKRTVEEKKDLIKRLNIIEGQVKGVKEMIAKDRYCDDILMQISAIDKGLKSIGNKILKGHITVCTHDDIKNNDEETIDNILNLFNKLYK